MTNYNELFSEHCEVKFSFYYSVFSFLSSGILVLVYILCEGVSVFGSILYSPEFLIAAAIFELIKVGLAKLVSGHTSSLRLPRAPSQEFKALRGPFLRRLWIRGARIAQALTPAFHFLKGSLTLLAFWILLTYLTVCFGAPVFSNWVETGSFTCLLLLLTAYPILLTKGPSYENLTSVLLKAEIPKLAWFSSQSSTVLEGTCDPLDRCLYYNTILTLVGAWVGAFPIPLDWDRDWQVWPISCCLGAVSGSVLSNMLGAITLYSRVSHQQSGAKRKYI